MRDIGIPNGIGGVGYTEADVAGPRAGHHEAAAAAGDLPETPTEDDIAGILTRSVENW